MSNKDIVVEVTIPKAIGDSTSLTLKQHTTVLDAIRQLNQQHLFDKVIKNDIEFNRFVLIYLNGERIKDPLISMGDHSDIDIIIPMAGG